MILSLTKKELRTIYQAKRMALSQDEVIFLSEKLLKNFILQFNPVENQKVNVFLSIERFNEVHTQIFIDYFFEKEIRVFVPKITGETIISVEIFPDSRFEVNRWGIKEPMSNIASDVHLDCVLTPLLYCDASGNRVGYGKGFYDQFFSENLMIKKKIGLNFFPPHEVIADVYQKDVQMDVLLTPNQRIDFNENS